MTKVIKFENRFSKKLNLKNSGNEFVCTIEIAVTTDNIGAPIIHISCDEEEIFENHNTYQLSFFDLLTGIADQYLDGFYFNQEKPVRSYQHLASSLRHFANLLELRAEDNDQINKSESYT